MSRKTGFFSVAAAALLIIALCSAPNALAVGSFYVFGDSACDNGNVLAYLMAAVPGLQPSDVPGIVDGRLSNGSNFVDYISRALNRAAEASLLGGTNHAYGGALMGFGESRLPIEGVGFYVPSTGSEINSFVADCGSFAADDLVILFAGHNDGLLMITQGVVADPVEVATQLGQNLEMLYAKGARTILAPTLYPLDLSPAVTEAGAGSAMQEWIAAYEAKAAEAVARFRAGHQDAVVLRPDTEIVINTIVADPARFGFTNVSNSAFDPNTDQAVPDADRYLWWDEAHLTTRGQRIVAQELLGSLSDHYHPGQMLPQAAASTMQLSRWQAQDAMRRTALRLRGLGRPDGPGAGLQAYAEPYHAWGRQSSGSGPAGGYGWKATGVDMGVMKRLGSSLVVGLALDSQQVDSDGDAGCGDARITGLGVHPYMQWAGEQLRLGLGARYAGQDNRASRPIWLTGRTADANFSSNVWSAWGETGWRVWSGGGVSLEPMLGLDWTQVGGLTTDESGADLMNSQLTLENFDSLRHLLGLGLSTSLETGWAGAVSISGLVGWRHEYLDDATRSQSTLVVTSRPLEGPSEDRDSLQLDLRTSCPLPFNGAVAVSYSSTYSPDNIMQMVALDLSVRF